MQLPICMDKANILAVIQGRSQRGFRGFRRTHGFFKTMKWNPRILRERGFSRCKILIKIATYRSKLVMSKCWNPQIEIPSYAPVQTLHLTDTVNFDYKHLRISITYSHFCTKIDLQYETGSFARSYALLLKIRDFFYQKRNCTCTN